MARQHNLKLQLRQQTMLLGTWQKTPSSIVTEILTHSALDLICLDAEHAPFDRATLDSCIFAAGAGQMPALVRVQSAESYHILNALDLGATGVVIPHVASRDDAERAAKLAHFGPGGRGYAGSTRFADYTSRSISQNLESGFSNTVVIAQIEDAEAIDVIDAIAEVDNIDCLFVGRADLAVSLGATSITDPIVIEASQTIAAAAQRHNRAVGMFISDLSEVPSWTNLGVSLFLLESDQTFLLNGAKSLCARFGQSCPPVEVGSASSSIDTKAFKKNNS